MIGSAPVEHAPPDSDWDLLVFGERDSMSRLQAHTPLHRNDVDCLVMIDSDRFQSAWGRSRKGARWLVGTGESYRIGAQCTPR